MPALIAWFGSALASVIAWFSAQVSSQVAIRLLVISLWVGIVVAMVSGINALVDSVVVAAPTGLFATGIGLLPGNTAVCLSAYFAARVLLWVYAWQAAALVHKAG